MIEPIKLYVSCYEGYGVAEYEGDPIEFRPGGYVLEYYTDKVLVEHNEFNNLPDPTIEIKPANTDFELKRLRNKYTYNYELDKNIRTLQRIQSTIIDYTTQLNSEVDNTNKKKFASYIANYKLLEHHFTSWFIESGLMEYLPQVENNISDSTLIQEFSDFPNLVWENINITFITKDTVTIKANEASHNFHYSQLGFKDNRQPEQFSRLWLLLVALAIYKHNTDYSNGTAKYGNYINKMQISRLRTKLKSLFGLSADPIPYSCKSKFWDTQFQLKINQSVVDYFRSILLQP